MLSWMTPVSRPTFLFDPPVEADRLHGEIQISFKTHRLRGLLAI